jgi:hypothetical protein
MDVINVFFVGTSLFIVVVMIAAFRFQSNYIKALRRQAEALERIATSLEKRG